MVTITLRDYHEDLNSYFESEAYEEIVGHCQHILQHYPKNIETYRIMGRALLPQPKYHEDAIEVFRRVLSAEPADFLAHHSLSQIFETRKDYDSAIWHMERIFDVFPNSADVIKQIRRLYLTRDGHEVDKVQMTRAGLARQYFNSQLYTQAIRELQLALERAPQRYDLMVLLAEALYAEQYPSEAGELALTVLKRLPNCLPANKLLARLWLDYKRPSDAQVFIKRVEDVAPYESLALIDPDAEASDNAFALPRLDWQATQRAALATSTPDWMNDLGGSLSSQGTGALVAPSTPDWFSPGVDFSASQPSSQTSGDMTDWFSEIETAPPPSSSQTGAADLGELFSDMDFEADDLPMPDDLYLEETPSPDERFAPEGFTGFLTNIEETRGQQAPNLEVNSLPDELDWFSDLEDTYASPPPIPEPSFEMPAMDDLMVEAELPDFDFAELDHQEVLPESPPDEPPALPGMTDFLRSMHSPDTTFEAANEAESHEELPDHLADLTFLDNMDDLALLAAEDSVAELPSASNPTEEEQTEHRLTGLFEFNEDETTPETEANPDEPSFDAIFGAYSQGEGENYTVAADLSSSDVDEPDIDEPDVDEPDIDEIDWPSEADFDLPDMTELPHLQDTLDEAEAFDELFGDAGDFELEAVTESETSPSSELGLTELLGGAGLDTASDFSAEQDNFAANFEAEADQVDDFEFELEAYDIEAVQEAEAAEFVTDDDISDDDLENIFAAARPPSAEEVAALLAAARGEVALEPDDQMHADSEDDEPQEDELPERMTPSEGTIPEWLNAVKQAQEAETEWMSASSQAQPAAAEAAPDWLSQDETNADWLDLAGEAESEGDPLTETNFDADWLSLADDSDQLDDSDSLEEAAPAEAMPDWLSGAPSLSPSLSNEAETLTDDWLGLEDAEPEADADWLSLADDSDLPEEAAPAEAMPDWLSGAPASETEAEAVADDWLGLGEIESEADADWLSLDDDSDSLEEAAPAEAMPDWLSGAPSLSPSLSNEAETLTDDWLGLGEIESEAEGDWLSLTDDSDSLEEAAPAEAMPDWLSGAPASETEAEPLADDWLGLEDAEPEADADWLSLDDDSDSLGEAAHAEAMPDWLSSATEAEPEVVADWLRIDQASDGDWLDSDDSPEAAISDDIQLETDWLSVDDAPETITSDEPQIETDWLNLDDDSEAEAEDISLEWLAAEPAKAEPEALTHPQAPQADPQAAFAGTANEITLDWLTQPLEEEASDPAEATELSLDWLTQPPELEEETAPKAEPSFSPRSQFEEPEEIGLGWLDEAEEDPINPDDPAHSEELPDWLRASLGLAEADSAPNYAETVAEAGDIVDNTEESNDEPDDDTGAFDFGYDFSDVRPAWLREQDDDSAKADFRPPWMRDN